MDTVLLIDFSNFLHKGLVAFSQIDNTKPSYTIAYNYFTNLSWLINELLPTKIFLCGEGGKTFRHDLYSDYKSNRIIKTAAKTQKEAEDFNRQRDIAWQLSGYLPLWRVFADGYEADDVIATLADSLKDEDAVIVSNDKDFIQLLQKPDANLTIYDPFKRDYVEAPDYHQLTFQSLYGDSVDTVPSITTKKIAQKLASNPEALGKFLSVEENRSNYTLNKELIELRIIDYDKLQVLDFELNDETLRKEFEQMEFKSFLGDWEKFKQPFKTLR